MPSFSPPPASGPTPLDQSAPADALTSSSRAPDIRLIAVDMDGTLLDDEKRTPPGLRAMLDELRERDVVFCPASGRQLATLRQEFDDPDLPYIAENGGYVVHRGHEVSSVTLPEDLVLEILTRLATAIGDGLDAAVVICGKKSAYLARRDEHHRHQADHYYRALSVVTDPTALPDDEILKIAVFHPEDASRHVLPVIGDIPQQARPVVSAQHWLDVMPSSVSKGAALADLQRVLGVSPAQTMAFGDYLNDLELLAGAEHSYAMANAHPDVRARARHLAPSNTENGVLRTISEVLGIR